MVLSNVESEVLGFLLDDLEAPQSLDRNVSIALGHAVTCSEILTAMVRLAVAGLAQAYEYDPASNSYRAVENECLGERRDVWFKATAVGREFIEDVA